MPEIPVGAQIFDVVFHPTFSTVYTGLLTGHVKAFSYDEQGNHKAAFSVRPSKSSCRGLSLNEDGSHLYAVGKGKALFTIDTTTESVDARPGAHDSTINCVKHLMPWLLSTGDDDGTVKLWDPRQRESIRTYTQHFDYITDFLWLDAKKQLVATSGDGTLSVMDVRSKKLEPIAQSEDQEDELLSIVAIKGINRYAMWIYLSAPGGTKYVVGTQTGILSIFNRSSGWGDCVDRVPGHPLSVDALCTLPSDLPNVDTASTILTGSSDGYVRAVQILPTTLLGVVADHGEWPIERISIGSGQGQLSIESNEAAAQAGSSSRIGLRESENDQPPQKRWWVGSVGHEDVLRMTDLEGFFRDNQNGEDSRGALGVDVSGDDSDLEDDQDVDENEDDAPEPAISAPSAGDESESSDDASDQDEESDDPEPKQRKRKAQEGVPFVPVKKQKGKKAITIERSFFDEL